MTTVFETPWFRIDAVSADTGAPTQTADLQDASSSRAPYYVLHSDDGAITIPVLEDGRFLMVRQYRPARKKMSLEFPAGHIDPGETPEIAAKRELTEETGWKCDRLIPLAHGGLSLHRESAKHHFFLAVGMHQDLNRPPEHGMETILCTAEELKRHIAAGNFEQFVALGALLMAVWDENAAPHLPQGLLP